MRGLRTGFSGVSALLPGMIWAAGVPGEATLEVEEISVTGEDAALEGSPRTATEGYVLPEQLEQRPVSRPAELLEFMPGMIATQHSGEGKGNQYFLRGFNLDHGTDFAVDVAGMPVNMPSHAHGQGYADLNFLLPELVEVMEYRKGPYYADVGDFSTAGSARFVYKNRLRPMAEVTAGENDYRRGFIGGSTAVAGGELLMAGAVSRYDGPWEVDQDLRKTNVVARYSRQNSAGGWNVTAMGYDNEWNATDQIPQRAVESGRIDRYGAVDPTDGGESHRYSLSAGWNQWVNGGRWEASAYAVDYRLDLFSNFTYFLDDPVNGDQFEQLDERRIYGAETTYGRSLTLAGVDSQLRVGFETRYDDISEVGLYHTDDRQRLSTTREDAIDEVSAAMYGELRQRWTPAFRSVLGLRLDHYRFDVDARRSANSGQTSDTLLSPKVNLIFGPWNETEYFLSLGRGFHSNDARGSAIEVDPATGDPVDAVDPLVGGWSMDIGLRSAVLPDTKLSATAFAMKLDSELVYVGDAGGTEASDASRRYGVELGALYSPRPWLIVDADLAVTRARFTGGGDSDHIPNAVPRVASLGVSLDDLDSWNAGLRLRHFSAAPLVPDNSVRSDATTLLNGRIGYDFGAGWSAALSGYNLLDSEDNDITYYYTSRLEGEPAQGTEDVHFHPVEPRTFRLTVRKRF